MPARQVSARVQALPSLHAVPLALFGYAQGAGWEALLQSTLFHQLQPRSRAILKKVLNGSSGIATRHLALENLGQAFELTPDVLQAGCNRGAAR